MSSISTPSAGIEIAKDPLDLALDYQWSPDGRFLGYTLNESNSFSGVYIWSVADGISRRVTPEFFNAQSPAWAPNGELLYFLSAREYRAIDQHGGIRVRHGPADRHFRGRASPGREEPVRRAQRRARRQGATARTETQGHRWQETRCGRIRQGDKDFRKTKTAARVTIDFDGIMGRVIRVPIEADNLSDLRAGEDTLLYQRNGAFYYGRDAEREAQRHVAIRSRIGRRRPLRRT